MKIDFVKINELCLKFENNHMCSNYEHKNPTYEELQAFSLEILGTVKEENK